MRVHLALFYFYGLYYHWSKRATGETILKQHRMFGCLQLAGMWHE